MKTLLHNSSEQVCDCMEALIAWKQAVREVNNRPSPEAKHWERQCYRVLDQFPDAVQKAAAICVSRRAAA